MMQFIKPAWPVPDKIHAFTTTRHKGSSLDSYSSFNLAQHVGDDPKRVANNRQLLKKNLHLPSEPVWLQQVHSNEAVMINHEQAYNNPIADAAITATPNLICTVLTADCLPILLCNRAGTVVCAIHAGWRGLAKGIIENTVCAMNESPSKLMAWLGPAIGPHVFEVSEEVLQLFMMYDRQTILAFTAKPETQNKWLANLYLLATMRLNTLGVTAIYGGEYCTFSDQQNFYSYRRDGITGRMATLIWLSA